MFIPRGNYLTVAQYHNKIGCVVTKYAIITAIKQGRLKGSIRLDKTNYIIPENAVLFSRTIKTGKHIGVSAWIRGEIEHQEETRLWEVRQAQLRKMREGDLKDDEEPEDVYH